MARKVGLISVLVLGLALAAAPALAHHPWPPIGSDVLVTNVNNATVSNSVGVEASTGYNTSVGSLGGDGGDAGNATAWKGGTALTGSGGDGGSASGSGGKIKTGDAYAKAKVVNVVNKNVTRILR